MTYRLFMYDPPGIMSAQVNQLSFTYPLGEVTMDTIGPTADAWQFVTPEMTVVFGTTPGSDDLGRQRIREAPTSTTLYFGRSSQGERDGEVNLADNVHITVYVDFRAWAKIPYIDHTTDPATIYKDHDLVVGTNTSQIPPTANTGTPAIGDIDPGTGKFRVTVPEETNTSWPVADGATITGYQWALPGEVTLVSGALTDGQITVDVDPGCYWLNLVVTDSNGKTHQSFVPVVARDPGVTPGFIPNFEIVSPWEETPAGKRVSVRILSDIDKVDYPDGTLVIIYDGNPTSLTDRSNVKFWGWHQGDPQTIRSERTGIKRDVVLECVDIGGRLAILPGFPFIIGSDAANFAGWSYMPDADWRKFLDYHLRWHTSALTVADWLPSSQLANYHFVERPTAGGNIYRQVHEQAQAVCPDFHFTVNRKGQMLVRVDPMLQLPANRSPETQVTLTENNWRDIQVTGKHWPSFHWLREEAIEATAGPAFTTFFSIAPGLSPGQGEGEAPKKEHLAQSQAELNSVTGQRYGRHNAPQTFFRIVLWSDSDGGIDPAHLTWVKLTIPAEYAAQRGLSFTEARGLVHRLTRQFRYAPTGTVQVISIIWERETEGIPGVTWTPPTPPA